MEGKSPRFPTWVKILIGIVLLFLLLLLFGTGGQVRDAKAADGDKVKLCNKSGACVIVTKDWISRGKVDPTKTKSKTEISAMASRSRNELCTTRTRVREYANLFGQTLARTRLRKSWCYNPATDRITYLFKPTVLYETTWLGSNTGWDDAGSEITEEWIPNGHIRHWAHQTTSSVKFRRCFEALVKVCLGSVRIISKITAFGDGRSKF